MCTKYLRSIIAVCLLGTVASLSAAPKIIRDDCNMTSGDGMGHSCPNDDYLLVRPRYEDGKCGDWMCCPPNPDGKTYDCTKAVNPTSAVGTTGLKGALAPNSTLAVDPSTGTTTVRPPAFGTKLPTLQRALEGEQPSPPPETSREFPRSPGRLRLPSGE